MNAWESILLQAQNDVGFWEEQHDRLYGLIENIPFDVDKNLQLQLKHRLQHLDNNIQIQLEDTLSNLHSARCFVADLQEALEL